MTIYDKVKEAAVKAGYNISKLEKEAGLGNGTISGWKDGDPKVGTLKRVADVLKMKIEELL